jgi:geranylgeranyl pyrophosphate synthase
MAWTHRITSKDFERGDLFVSVEFTDGVQIVVSRFRITEIEILKQSIATKLVELEDSSAVAGQIPTGQAIDLTPVRRTQTAAEAWHDLFRKWLRIRQAIGAGILTGAEPEVSAIEAKLKADYRTGFLDLF